MTVVNAVETRLGRLASLALLLAALCGAVLFVGGFLAPVYESASGSSTGEVSQGAGTLVGVNGPGVVIILGLPLLITLAAGCALWQGPRRGAMTVAWTLTGLLAALNLLAMLSIGVFVLPVTAALIVACAARRPPRTPSGLSPWRR